MHSAAARLGTCHRRRAAPSGERDETGWRSTTPTADDPGAGRDDRGEMIVPGAVPDDPEATREVSALAARSGKRRARSSVAVCPWANTITSGRRSLARRPRSVSGGRVQARSTHLVRHPRKQRSFSDCPATPFSAMVTFVLLVAPALRAMIGAPEPDRRTARGSSTVTASKKPAAGPRGAMPTGGG